MPQHVPIEHEPFMADVALERPHLARVNTLVLAQIRARCKLFMADSALEWSFAGVRAHVLIQLAVVDETFVAYSTLEWAIDRAGVCTSVLTEAGAIHKQLIAATVALQQLFAMQRVQMLIQQRLIDEIYLAKGAFYRFTDCRSCLMVLERDERVEAFMADIAFARFAAVGLLQLVLF